MLGTGDSSAGVGILCPSDTTRGLCGLAALSTRELGSARGLKVPCTHSFGVSACSVVRDAEYCEFGAR